MYLNVTFFKKLLYSEEIEYVSPRIPLYPPSPAHRPSDKDMELLKVLRRNRGTIPQCRNPYLNHLLMSCVTPTKLIKIFKLCRRAPASGNIDLGSFHCKKKKKDKLRNHLSL